MGRGSSGHAAIFSSPGMGHRIPVVELSKRLVDLHGFSVTIFFVKLTTSPQEPDSRLPSQIQFVDLPTDISGLVEPGSAIVTQIAVSMREATKSLRQSISVMKHKPTMLIADFFGTDGLDVAVEFGLPKYVFFTTSAWFFALTRHLPVLDREVVGEYVSRIEPLPLPGCKSLRPEDVVDPMMDRSDRQYREYVQIGVNLQKADGILLNSWEDLEPTTLAAVRETTAMPIHAVGPLTTRPGGPPCGKSGAIEWLDKQPEETVIYVSFGSGGTLSAEQTYELASGLELSGHRFLWVMRPPTNGLPAGAFFDAGDAAGHPCSRYLPDEFLTRTQGQGLVVPFWAPQVDVLRHPSVGGFISHCGWNSTLESIVNGVPLVAWPLYAEQKMNATMLADELRVAVRPRVNPWKEVVRRDEVSVLVTSIMEGDEGKAVRCAVKQLQSSAEKALSMGGSSYLSLSQFFLISSASSVSLSV